MRRNFYEKELFVFDKNLEKIKKRKMKMKIIVIMALMVLLTFTASATVYTPNERGMTSSYMPTTACELGTPYVRIGNNVNTSGGPCNDAANNGRFYAYWKFVNITPADSLLFNCTTIYGPGASGNGRSLLYRVDDMSWSNETITYTNQPAYCSGESCWNAYGGIVSDRGSVLNLGGLMNDVEWDLNTVYGEEFGPMNEITLFFADENSSSYSTFSINDCFLIAEGIYNQSDIQVYVFDNYAGISNMEIQICTTDYLSCTYKFTDLNGYALFSVPFGDYVIDAEYAIMNLSYSETFSFTDETETVNIHFNTVGPGSIGGYVYWPNGTGAPFAIVNVSGNNDYTAVTDLTGEYLISPIVKGNYTIQAFKAGLQSEFSTFRCTGDDSINLNLQGEVFPPDGYSHTFINITTFTDVMNPLGFVNVEKWEYTDGCPESCFIDSACRNTQCIHNFEHDRITTASGLAIMNFLTPVALPTRNTFYLYAYKSGYVDDHAVVIVVSNYTPVSLYLNRLQNTSVTLHELNNLQNIYVRVTPNIGPSQTAYTDSGGNVTFTFATPISRLMVNATISNPSYSPYNFIYPISGNPVYITFEMPNRTTNYFNLYGYLFDDLGNNVSNANVQLRCRSCTPSFSCGNINTNADGYYSFTNVPYFSHCLLHATPPNDQYSDLFNWIDVRPTWGIPDTYVNMTPGLRFRGGNVTPGTVYLKLLVTDKGTGEPILGGSYDYVVNGTDTFHGTFPYGYVHIQNLNPGSNVSLQLTASNYESVSYFMPVGTSDYEANDRLSMRWIGGATTRPTTTIWDTPTFPTTVPTTTTTTILFIPEDITVYEMSNESENILDTAWAAGISFFGSLLLLAGLAAPVALLIGILFLKKIIDALM